MNYQIDPTRPIYQQSDSLWMTFLRSRLKRGDANPAFCIQGGGARGAWEAGALAGLLKAGVNTTPSSIWGTSAGALNALWSRDPSIQAKPANLLRYWITLARRLICVAMAGFLCFLWVLCRFSKLTIACLVLVGLTFALLYILTKLGVLTRLPGLVSPRVARLIVPRPKIIGPGWHIYTCVSDVESQTRPDFWPSESKRGWFCLHPDASNSLAEHIHDGEMVDAFHVAVASASVPLAVGPTRLAGMTLMDGGLVANLPAGFISTNGSLGGAYILCVVPRDVAELSSSNSIDYRTLRFLFELRDEQSKHRSEAAATSSWGGPAHTHIPVFVLSPKRRLKSGLLTFFPRLLRQEFSQGFQEAMAFAAALEEFSRSDIDLSNEYLLERVLEKCSAPVGQPPRGFWYTWANSRW